MKPKSPESQKFFMTGSWRFPSFSKEISENGKPQYHPKVKTTKSHDTTRKSLVLSGVPSWFRQIRARSIHLIQKLIQRLIDRGVQRIGHGPVEFVPDLCLARDC